MTTREANCNSCTVKIEDTGGIYKLPPPTIARYRFQDWRIGAPYTRLLCFPCIDAGYTVTSAGVIGRHHEPVKS